MQGGLAQGEYSPLTATTRGNKSMQTLPKNHLTMRLVRLHQADEWKEGAEGWSMILFKGGTGRYVLRESKWNLVPGDVIVLNPAAGGRFFAQNGEAVFWCFSFCMEHLLPLFSAEEICMLQSIADAFKDSKFYGASSSVANECHSLVEGVPPNGNIDHRGHVLRIASAVLSVEFLNARNERNGYARTEDHIIQVFESLSAEDLLNLSVDELASRFSCSRRHLNRLFHQHFGFSVAALRMEMRLLKAVSLLRNPAAKVINVAEQCGFNHLGLFNTCFKRRFNSSPGQWRKTASLQPAIPGLTFNGSGSARSMDSAQEVVPDSPVRTKVVEMLTLVSPNGTNRQSYGVPNGRLDGRRPNHEGRSDPGLGSNL